MVVLEGIAASAGIGIGRAVELSPRLVVESRWVSRSGVLDEMNRLSSARHATEARLDAVESELRTAGDVESLAVIEAHRLLLKSSHFVEPTERLIREEQWEAASAVQATIASLVRTFEAMPDPYLRQRSADVEEVGERLLRVLLQIEEDEAPAPGGDVIVTGTVLTVVDAIRYVDGGAAGLATERGGIASHAALLVRAAGLPMVIGVHGLLQHVTRGCTIVVDGTQGIVVVDPTPAVLQQWNERRARRVAPATVRRTSAGPLATRDGVRIALNANIDRLDDVARALAHGADGIGLLRTELLHLEREDLPSEQEQYEDAIAAIRALAGRPATFRTLDLGGDKLPASARRRAGRNPALGLRGIRLSLARPDILRAQLRAFYRASVEGPMRIMFPMVSHVVELEAARAACQQVMDDLTREGVPFSTLVPIGTMVETPSAAMAADHLAAASDFFSVGTNDLFQYAFAADREDDDVNYLYHPLDPAMLRMLELVVASAERARKPLAVCGDMAGDGTCVEVLLGLGVRDLSVATHALDSVRAIVESTTIAEARALASGALELRTARDVEEYVAHNSRVGRSLAQAVHPAVSA